MTVAAELATGYVSLAVSTEGLGKQVLKQFDGVRQIARTAGRDAGTQLSSGLTKGASSGARAVSGAADKIAAARAREMAAAKKVEAAEKALTTTRAQAGVKAAQVKAAEDKVAQAKQSVQAAATKLGAAEQKLNQLRVSGTATGRQIVTAERNLSTAKAGLQRATEQQTNAENRVNVARAQQRQVADRLGTAETRLAAAKSKHVAAQREVTTETIKSTGQIDRLGATTTRASAPVQRFTRNLLDAAKAKLPTGLVEVVDDLGESAQRAGTKVGSLKDRISSGVGRIKPPAGMFQPVVDAADDAGDKAGRELTENLDKSVRGGAGKLKTAITGGIAGAFAAVGAQELVGAFKNTIDAASDFNETINKSSVIFGDQSAAMDAWASNAARQFGLSKSAALEAASGFGDMFSQLGFGGDQAAKMSQQVVQMATDFGSFNNLPTAEVSDMISAAFRGEYDSLQRLVPNINAARVEQEALAATGKKSAKQLTAQEKATATLAILQKDGARATGDFARTSDGFANQQKIAAAQVEDLKAKLGQGLLPIATQVMGFFTDTAIPAIESFSNQIGPAKDAVAAFFAPTEASPLAGMLATVNQSVTTVGDGLRTNVLPAFENLGSAVQGAWSVVQPIINQLGSLFADKIAQWGPQIQPMLTQVTQIIGGAVNIIAEIIRLVFGGIQAFWQAWGGTILAYLGNAFDMIVGIVGGALDVVQGVIKTVLSLIRGDWQGAFEGIKQITGGVLRIVLAIVNGVLNNIKIIFSGVVGFILNNIWLPFWNGARGVASGVMGSIRGLITAILNGIRGTFGSIVSIIRGLWSAGFNFLRSVASGVMSSTRGIISGILGGIRGAFSSVMGSIRGIWSGGLNAVRNTAGSVMGSVRGAIGRVLDGIKNAFSTAVGAIGRAWDGIRSKAAQPVRFVVNTVFNNGIRSAFNTVAGLFGMSKINPVRLGFASGGVLPGYTPGRDVHRFLSPTGGVLDLSGGEGILRPEITRMLGARGLAVLNSLRGGAGQVRQKLMELLGHQAFAGGGLVSFRGGRFTERFAAVLQRAFQMSGNGGRLTQGGWRPTTSYSGTSHAGDAVDVVGILPRLVVALRQLGVAAWQRTPSQGNWPWHVHAVPGPSAGRAGGSGISQWRSYLGGGNGLGGSDDGPRVGAKSGLLDKIGEFTEGMMDIFVSADPLGSIRGLFDSALGKSVPGSGWFADMIGKVPRMIVDGIIDKARDVLPGFANGGITPRGPIVVGERGPEVLWPGPGHMITPNGAAVGGASAQEIAGALDEALGRRLSTLGPRELAMLLRDPVMSR